MPKITPVTIFPALNHKFRLLAKQYHWQCLGNVISTANSFLVVLLCFNFLFKNKGKEKNADASASVRLWYWLWPWNLKMTYWYIYSKRYQLFVWSDKMLFLLSQSMLGYNQTYILLGDNSTIDLKSYTLTKSNFRHLTRTVLI